MFNPSQIDKFEQLYRVYTGAFVAKNSIDHGGKILLPTSTLTKLSKMNIVFPIMFKVSNTSTGKYTHCGVLEFSAQEGQAIIPFWMQEHLQLAPGQLVKIETATIPKGSFVKLRPQQTAFINLSDPKAILEQKLRDFSCLTKGDTIIIKHLNKDFFIDIMEVKSQSGPCNAISIVETDVEVEFERPLDMPPSPVAKPSSSSMFDTKDNTNNDGLGFTIGSEKKKKKSKKNKESKNDESPSFAAFAGSGRRLDGKVHSPSSSPKISNMEKANRLVKSKSTKDDNKTDNGNGIVFGESPKSSESKKDKKEKKKEEESGFVPFSGKGRTLK